jgi:hypothetical protein
MQLATRSSFVKYVQSLFFTSPTDTTLHPNQLIFPNQRLSTKAEMTHVGILQDKFQGDNNAIDHSGNIYVYAAFYCKVKKGAQHEFIMLHVRDKADPSKENFIALDMVPQNELIAPPPPDLVVAEDTPDGLVQPAAPDTRVM